MVHHVQTFVQGPVAGPQERFSQVRVALTVDEREAQDAHSEVVNPVQRVLGMHLVAWVGHGWRGFVVFDRRPPTASPIHKICAAEDEAPHPRRRGRPTERHGRGIGDGGAFFFRDATEGGAEMYDCHDALERATHRISIAQVAQGNFDAELAQWLGAPEITHENAYGRIVTYQARHESTSEAAGGPCHEMVMPAP